MSSSTTLDVKIDATSRNQQRYERNQADGICSLPIENSVTEWPGRAAASEEQVPHLVCESLSLGVGGEPDLACGAAQTERHELSLGLARLDVCSHRGTGDEVGAGEDVAVPVCTSLE